MTSYVLALENPVSHVLRVKVKGCIPGYAVGQVVTVPCDEHGTPLALQWRRRLRDSRHDGCLEVLEPEAPKPPEVEKEPRRRSAAKE